MGHAPLGCGWCRERFTLMLQWCPDSKQRDGGREEGRGKGGDFPRTSAGAPIFPLTLKLHRIPACLHVVLVVFFNSSHVCDFAQGDITVSWGCIFGECFFCSMFWNTPGQCCNVVVLFSSFVFQSCEVMAAASVNRPGSAQTAEKSQLILKGNRVLVSSCCLALWRKRPDLFRSAGVRRRMRRGTRARHNFTTFRGWACVLTYLNVF